MESTSSLRTRLLDDVDPDDDDDVNCSADAPIGVSISISSTINCAIDASTNEDQRAPTKTINFLYSFCMHLNNLTGPALVLLPLINQEAGWLPCTFGVLLPLTIRSL
jgi:hypothetical protein